MPRDRVCSAPRRNPRISHHPCRTQRSHPHTRERKLLRSLLEIVRTTYRNERWHRSRVSLTVHRCGRNEGDQHAQDIRWHVLHDARACERVGVEGRVCVCLKGWLWVVVWICLALGHNLLPPGNRTTLIVLHRSFADTLLGGRTLETTRDTSRTHRRRNHTHSHAHWSHSCTLVAHYFGGADGLDDVLMRLVHSLQRSHLN